MLEKLMPKGYFESIQREMVRAGFAHISTVPIDSTECAYHVPALVARATSMFFHRHGKSFLVMLRYHEHIEEAGSPRVGNWRMDFYIRFKGYRTLLDENPEWLGRSMDEMDGGLYHDMPILGSTKFEIEGFRHFGGVSIERDTNNEQVGLHLEEPYGGTEALAPEVLTEKVRAAFQLLEKYLDRGPIFRPQLTDFIPHYTFSGQDNRTLPWKTEKLEETFWAKFDWHYFRHLVVHPWGYNYRGKPAKPCVDAIDCTGYDLKGCPDKARATWETKSNRTWKGGNHWVFVCDRCARILTEK